MTNENLTQKGEENVSYSGHPDTKTPTLSDKIMEIPYEGFVEADDIKATNQKILERIEELKLKKNYTWTTNWSIVKDDIVEIIKSEMGEELI